MATKKQNHNLLHSIHHCPGNNFLLPPQPHLTKTSRPSRGNESRVPDVDRKRSYKISMASRYLPEPMSNKVNDELREQIAENLEEQGEEVTKEKVEKILETR